MHDHGPRLSDDAFSPAAGNCPSTPADLPCGCQDVRYACGYIDREHDHVECPGTPAQAPPPSLPRRGAQAKTHTASPPDRPI